MRPSRNGARERKRTQFGKPIPIIATLLLTLLAYSNSFQSGFVLDNRPLLLQDPRIQEASQSNVELIFQHSYWWPHGESYLYRPLTTLSYLFNYTILGNSDHSAGYHWINLILHAGNVLLLYFLVLRLTSGFWLALCTASLWAVHPVLTESVTNIAGRADLLATVAVLAAFLIYLKSRNASSGARLFWLALLALVTTIGVFSKETAALIPVVMLLYELILGKGPGRLGALLRASPVVLLPVGAMLSMRFLILAGLPPMHFPFGDNPLVAAGFWTARLTAVKIIGRYLSLLSCDYSFAQIPLARSSPGDWTAVIFVVLLLVGAVVLFRKNRTAFFFAGFAVITFLPVSNLLFPIGSILAERFLYLPSIGIVAWAVLLMFGAGKRIKATLFAPAIVCLLIGALSVRTWFRNMDWHDDLALASAAVRVSPESYKTHALLADALYASDSERSHIDRVIGEAEKSLAILDPLPDIQNVPAAYEDAGKYYVAKGDLLLPHALEGQMAAPPQSAQAYRRALHLLLRSVSIFQSTDRQHAEPEGAPGSARYIDSYGLLSTVYLRLGNTDRALDAAIHARNLNPNNPEIYRQISAVQIATGRPREAGIALLEGAIATSDPGLRDDLINLYRNDGEGSGCAVVSRAGGFVLNPSCETVHDQICTAAAEVVKLRNETHRLDLAEQVKRTAEREFGCP